MERSRRCKHFKPNGFIKTGAFGSTGLQLDLSRECKAAIKGMGLTLPLQKPAFSQQTRSWKVKVNL
jgi:hypothetical protein